MILSNINNLHFKIWYYNNNLELDTNFKIFFNKENPYNNKDNNDKKFININNEINSILEKNEFNKLINLLNNCSKKDIKDILEFYKNIEKEDI